MTQSKALTVSAMIFLLTGCSGTLNTSGIADWLVRADLPGDGGPLEYYLWTRTADTQALQAELTRLRDSSEPASDPAAAVQLVLINTALHPDSLLVLRESRALLAAADRDCPNQRCQAYLGLAALLDDLLESRQQLGLTLASKEEAVSTLNARIAALENQIDALTDIEQRLIERDPPEFRP